MKKLVLIFLLGIVCACGSNGSYTEEPNGGQTNGGDSVAVVDSIAVEDSTEIEPEAEPLTAELRPVLTLGKKWTMVKQAPRTGGSGCGNVNKAFITCEVIGDTLVYGKNCKLIKEVKGNRTGNLVWYEEDGFLYDEAPLPVNDSSEEIKYELRLAYTFYPQGVDATTRHKTLSRGTIVCLGKTRRAIKVFCGDAPEYADYYIEGIGPVYGTCLSIQSIQPACHISRCYILQKVYDGDELIFDIDDFSPSKYKEEHRFVEDYDKWFDF